VGDIWTLLYIVCLTLNVFLVENEETKHMGHFGSIIMIDPTIILLTIKNYVCIFVVCVWSQF